MWNRGGRSSALDRAQALLSGRRSSRGDAESVWGSTGNTGAVGGSVKTKYPPNPHPLLSDVSDLSSVSSAPDHGADIPGSAAGNTQERDGLSTKDLRPPSSLGGGGSRFLKKAPPPAINSSQSPVSKSQMQPAPEHRNVSSSWRGSQTAALSRLAQIESRIRSRKQVQELATQGSRPVGDLTSDVGISPPTPPAAKSLESPQSSSDKDLMGKRFLKNKTVVAFENNNNSAAARSPKGTDVGARSRSRAFDVVVPSSVRVVSGVSLESDEEDMRKLLGDSLDSIENSFLRPGRPSSITTADKKLSKSRQKVHPSPPPAAVPPSSSSNAPPHSPPSPRRRSSPFRFTGQAQAHFSPSALSPSPSPPYVSPSPPGRLNSPHRVGSPERSLSSMSVHGEVRSLEELFSVGAGSEDPDSEMSSVTSEDFQINVMTLDDLVPAAPGFTEETPGKEREVNHGAPLPGSQTRYQHRPRLKEKKEEQQQEEEEEEEDVVADYQSDFESESRTETDHSVSQVSEHLHGDGDGEEVVSEVREEAVSEVREEASDSDVSRRGTEDDYSSTFSASRTTRTSSRSSVSHGSRTSYRRSRRRDPTRAALKEAAVQTQPDPLAYTRPTGTLGPAVDLTYMDPSPLVALSADMVEALSSFNPAVFALNEMLKQQLAVTTRFIERSRYLHSSLVQSLGPPNYRYTTLEDTKEYIRKHRRPR